MKALLDIWIGPTNDQTANLNLWDDGTTSLPPSFSLQKSFVYNFNTLVISLKLCIYLLFDSFTPTSCFLFIIACLNISSHLEPQKCYLGQKQSHEKNVFKMDTDLVYSH